MADHPWPDYANLDRVPWCEERHPEAKPWEDLSPGRNSELNCGRPQNHDGPHVILMPDPCPECGAMAECSPDCQTYDPTPEPDPTKWPRSEWRTWPSGPLSTGGRR